jgi:hypothetical protein
VVGVQSNGEMRATIFSPRAPAAQITRNHADKLYGALQTALPVTSLHQALVDVLAGRLSPPEACASAINPDACCVSLREFNNAHELAMSSVQRGAVERSSTFWIFADGNAGGSSLVDCKKPPVGGKNWWLLNLYSAARNIPLGPRGLALVQRILGEAQAAGLIDTAESILATIIAWHDLDEGLDIVHAAGVRLSRMVFDVEIQLGKLYRHQTILHSRQNVLQSKQSELQRVQAGVREGLMVIEAKQDMNQSDVYALQRCLAKQIDGLQVAFVRFRKRQVYANAIGIGLQCIPFIGGVAATAVAGGAEVVGSMCESLLSAGVGAHGVAQAAMAERMLSAVADKLSPESLDSMAPQERERLDSAFYGIEEVQGPSDVCLILLGGWTGPKYVSEADMVEQIGFFLGSVSRALQQDESDPVIDELSPRPVATVEGGSASGDFDENRTEEKDDAGVGSTSNAGGDAEQACFRVSGVEEADFSELESRGVSRILVSKLKLHELGRHLAAHLVMYDSRRQSEYDALHKSVVDGLTTYGIDGDVLAGECMLDSGEFVSLLYSQLENDKVARPGYKVKLRSFIELINKC